MGLSFGAAGVSEPLVIPLGFSVFTNEAPPWIVTKESILGLAPGESRPNVPVYHGAGPMGVAAWSNNDITKGLGNSASNGPVPPQAIRNRVVAGLQFVPAMSGRAVPLWSTWHEGLLRALSVVFKSWHEEVENPALIIETAYASEAFKAMADALAAVDTSSGRPEVDPEDPVLARANAYTATLVDWLREHEEEIVVGILAYAATGEVAAGLAASLGTVAAGAAWLGPVGIIGVSVAILALAVYAYVTGARPGTTRGVGDNVLAFPRSGTDVDHIVYLRPVDVDAYTHAMYRAVRLDRQRRQQGLRPWEVRLPGLRPIEYHPTFRPEAVVAEESKALEEENVGKLPMTAGKKAAVAAGVAGGAGLLWWGLKALGLVGRRSRR